jgi:hypothetical protein
VDGISFTFRASSTGDSPNSLFYSYTYFDGTRSTWDAWSDWISVSPSSTFSFKAAVTSSKTKIAFSVSSSNFCGVSEQTRESSDQKGIFLLPSLNPEVRAAAELKAKQEAEAAIAKAAAELKAKQEAELKAAAELKAKQEAELKAAAELKARQDAEEAAAKAAAELKAKEEVEAIAAADLKAKQDAAAKAAALKKTTIVCVKGKLTKKITAIKPKCPAGYKKK